MATALVTLRMAELKAALQSWHNYPYKHSTWN